MFQRLFDAVTGRSTRERLAAIERALRKAGEGDRDRAAAMEARLADIGRIVADQPTAKDLRELRQALRGAAAAPQIQPLLDAVDQIGASGRPVLIGPWTGEVGFELLYWIPFVEWVRSRWRVPRERELVVSRGGVASWYAQSGDRYVDILSLVSVDDFRTAVAEEKRKHRRPGAFDARIADAVVRSRGLEEVAALHPGMMYRAFAPFWSDEAGYALVDQFTRPRLLERPSDPAPARLPADYVAVRFYFSDCFPASAGNRDFARRVVSALADHGPVVVLSPGVAVDEHPDWVPDAPDRIITIAEGLSPDRNLAVQSAAIAGARAFVGTYGGYAYLAPLYRVPAVAFFSRPTFKLHHLHAAQRTFAQIGAAALTPVDAAQAALVQRALGALVTV